MVLNTFSNLSDSTILKILSQIFGKHPVYSITNLPVTVIIYEII